MDFVEGLTKSSGFNTLWVVVDRLSKYAHFVGLHHPFTAQSVAAIFVRVVVRLHGFPLSIVSDRDKVFMSKFWAEIFRLQGTTLLRSTAYHPQTDGQTEIVNQALETYLRCFVNGQPRQWAKWLHWAEYCYNTSPHMSINMSPFMALYGRPPPSIIQFGNNVTPIDSVELWLKERDAIIDELKFSLLRAQRLKKWADKKRRELSFEVGDLVFLKLQPYRQQSVARRPCQKLSSRYYGPYVILEKVGKVAYKLLLPDECKIHLIFHVSKLKLAHGAAFNPIDIPDQLSLDMELICEPEQVLAMLRDFLEQQPATEVLIKRKNLPKFEATWEQYQNIITFFLDFHLEDKVLFIGAGIVMNEERPRPTIQHVYSRRGKK